MCVTFLIELICENRLPLLDIVQVHSENCTVHSSQQFQPLCCSTSKSVEAVNAHTVDFVILMQKLLLRRHALRTAILAIAVDVFPR